MEWIMDPQIWISLITLTFLEIILGVDNLIFISILSDKLPEEQQAKARYTGLALAIITRLLLLLALSALVKLTAPLFTVFEHAISGRDLILILGGTFLLYKSTHEIHLRLEGEDGQKTNKMTLSFSAVITQIMILDIVFSLDSIITAVGMVKEIWIMVTAIVVALIVMLLMMESINIFIRNHPTVKMLALSFLLLIGVTLVAEGLGHHFPKGYIYFAMGFSILVEFLNIKASKKKKAKKVQLNQAYR